MLDSLQTHGYKRAQSLSERTKQTRMGTMRRAKPGVVLCLVVLVVAGCSAMQGSQTAKPESAPAAAPAHDTPVMTAVPTVPPRTPTPVGAAPLATRPIKSEESDAAKKAGKLVGPVITHLGLARADGSRVEPKTKKDGIDVYQNNIGSGMIVVVEAKPGISNLEVGRRISAYDKEDHLSRPDLEIQSDKDLGNASPVVCDKRRPDIGGVPGINPPSFAETRAVADALNDLSCRFEVFIESASACTVTKNGDFSFLSKDSKVQFCMIVAKAWNFPVGDTLLSVRVRDKEGNPGPVKKLIVRRANPADQPIVKKSPPPKTPTPARRRP